MASVAAHHRRHHEQHLVQRPMLFERDRKTIAEVVALLWLATLIARLARSRRALKA